MHGDDRARDGKVTEAAGELADREAGATAPRGKPHTDEQLVRRERRRPEAVEERTGGDASLTPRRDGLELRIQRERDGGVLRGRIGVRD